VVSSDADTRLLNLGFNEAVALDLPTDIKEVLVADSQTVRVVVRTFRRVYIVGAAVRRTNIFFYANEGRQVAALDVSLSEASQLPPPELRDFPKWQRVGPGFAALSIGEVANAMVYNSVMFPTSKTPSFNIDSTRLGWVGGSGPRIRHDA